MKKTFCRNGRPGVTLVVFRRGDSDSFGFTVPGSCSKGKRERYFTSFK